MQDPHPWSETPNPDPWPPTDPGPTPDPDMTWWSRDGLYEDIWWVAHSSFTLKKRSSCWQLTSCTIQSGSERKRKETWVCRWMIPAEGSLMLWEPSCGTCQGNRCFLIEWIVSRFFHPNRKLRDGLVYWLFTVQIKLSSGKGPSLKLPYLALAPNISTSKVFSLFVRNGSHRLIFSLATCSLQRTCILSQDQPECRF